MQDQKLRTINDTNNIADFETKYEYQPNLSKQLESLEEDFNQQIINEIVLWKVNRYVKCDDNLLSLINQIKKGDKELNKELTKRILEVMLDPKQKGIRLAMASTILRFKNPYAYQIIDQRAYRFLLEKELSYPLHNVSEQIRVYLEYLEELKKVCFEKNIPFEKADKLFYQADKELNHEISIHYSGKKEKREL